MGISLISFGNGAKCCFLCPKRAFANFVPTICVKQVAVFKGFCFFFYGFNRFFPNFLIYTVNNKILYLVLNILCTKIPSHKFLNSLKYLSLLVK